MAVHRQKRSRVRRPPWSRDLFQADERHADGRADSVGFLPPEGGSHAQNSSRPGHSRGFRPHHIWASAPVTSVASAFRRKIVFPALAFLLVAGGLFAVNMAITGSWNYQGGGGRTSYYFEYPFQNEITTPEAGAPKSREPGLLTDIIFDPRTFWPNLTHNLQCFFFGRHAGLFGYFFPGVFAIAVAAGGPAAPAGLAMAGARSALVQGLIFVIGTPYTWSGGGVGNRYFFTGYAVMLFLLPPHRVDRGRAGAVGDRRTVRRADGAEPVRRVVPSRRNRQVRSAAAAAGRADAAQRSARRHRARAQPRMVR